MVELKNHLVVKRFNNSEYFYVVDNLSSQFLAYGAEKLKFPEGLFEQFQADVTRLKDMVLMSRSSHETEQLDSLDVELNKLLLVLLGVIRLERKNAISAKSTAASLLYSTTKSYKNVRKAPRRQKMAQIESLLYDLSKEDLSSSIQALGLAEEIESLTLQEARFKVLLNTRANTQMHRSLDKSIELRKEMDALLDVMFTCVRYSNYTTPSAELDEIILSINKLLSDVETEYNQRLAQNAKKEDGDTTEQGVETDAEADKPTADTTDDEVSKDDVTTGTPTDEPTEGDTPKDESNGDEL